MRAQLAAAQRCADAATKREAAAWRAAGADAAAMRHGAGRALDLVGQLKAAAAGAAAAGVGGGRVGGGRGAPGALAAGSRGSRQERGALGASEIAAMVDMSESEVLDLLGGDGAAAGQLPGSSMPEAQLLAQLEQLLRDLQAAAASARSSSRSPGAAAPIAAAAAGAL